MVVHLIQPYPNVQVTFEINSLGRNLVYSLNTILFSFSLLRLYVVIKIFLYWSLFTNPNSMRVYDLFNRNNRNRLAFFYKSNLKYYAMIFAMIIFFLLFYLASVIFKLVEDYEYNEEYEGDTIWNSYWFIIGMITTSIYLKFIYYYSGIWRCPSQN